MNPKQMTVHQLRDALAKPGDKKRMSLLVELVARARNDATIDPRWAAHFISLDRAEAKEFLEKGGEK